MRRATAYRRSGAFFVHASSQTTDGVWILAAPCAKLADSCSDAELGEAARAALGGSRRGVPHPRTWTDGPAPLLALAGVKSWSTFASGATCAELEEARGSVAIAATRNLGADGGFEPDPASATAVASDAVEALGAALRRALAR